jgi:hypothetical protein
LFLLGVPDNDQKAAAARKRAWGPSSQDLDRDASTSHFLSGGFISLTGSSYGGHISASKSVCHPFVQQVRRKLSSAWIRTQVLIVVEEISTLTLLSLNRRYVRWLTCSGILALDRPSRFRRFPAQIGGVEVPEMARSAGDRCG